jgi:hypothetical protein
MPGGYPPLANTNIRRTNWGSLNGGGGAQYTEDFYIYTVQFGTIANGATAPQQSIVIQADSSFEWIASTFFALEDGSAAPFPDAMQLPILCQISDGGSGRQLFSAAVPISSFAGFGREPFFLPVPRLFLSKSQVTFNANSVDPAATWNNVTLNLIGRKIFEGGMGGFPL